MSLQIISTEFVPLEQREELWLSQVIPGVTKATGTRRERRALTIQDIESFRGEWQHADLGFLRYSLVKCTPHALHIDPVVPPEQADPADRTVRATFQLTGITHVRNGKGQVLLTPGTWTASQGIDRLHLTHRTPVEHIVLAVDQRTVGFEGVEALWSFAAKHGVRRLIHEFVCDTFSALPIRGKAADEIAEMTVRLLRQAIAETDAEEDVTSGSNRQFNADDIKRFIDGHLGDPLLSLERIAAHFSCTKRTLHRAFAADGESVERYIWRRRIERCVQELSANAQSLTELAYRHGFNSSTHFSRLFKMYCGMTPTAFIRLSGETSRPFRLVIHPVATNSKG